MGHVSSTRVGARIDRILEVLRRWACLVVCGSLLSALPAFPVRADRDYEFPLPTSAAQAVSISYAGSALWSNMVDVDVVGSYAYCVLAYGLMIIDVSDLARPEIVSQLYLAGGNGYAIEVIDEFAYIADGEAGLRVVDISNVADPQLVFTHPTSGLARGVSVRGDLAVVTDHRDGLQVFDVSARDHPVWIASSVPLGSTGSVVLSGDFAYVICNGLRIVDVSEPTMPELVAVYDLSSTLDVAVAGTRAFLVGSYYPMRVLDVSDPSSPCSLATFPAQAYAIELVGNLAYLSGAAPGLVIVDVTDNLTPVGSLEIPGSPRGVAVSGYETFVTGYQSGLYVVNTSTPAVPRLLGSLEIPEITLDVVVAGDYACAAAAGSGLQVVDVSDASAPTRVAEYRFPDGAGAVAVSGSYAYLAGSALGLQIFDLSEPASPVLLGGYVPDAWVADVAVVGDHALVPCWSDGLHVVDVSDPASPVQVARFEFIDFAEPAPMEYVVASGDLAFVRAWGSPHSPRLLILDVTNPLTPGVCDVLEYHVPAEPTDVGVVDDRLYVANYGTGRVEIYDIATPSNATLLGWISNHDYPVAMAVSGVHVYVFDCFRVLRVYDATLPTLPLVVDSFHIARHVYSATVAGTTLCVADGAGLTLFTISGQVGVEAGPEMTPRHFELSQNRPNPFNAGTVIDFSVTETSRVDLSVYNILGRSVAKLQDAILPAGRHRVRWQGMSDDGREVPSGVYFCRLSAGGRCQVRKMLLLR